MITDINNAILYELGALRGKRILFCRCKQFGIGFLEGFVLVSPDNSFALKVESRVFDGRYTIHYLSVKPMNNLLLLDEYELEPIHSGVLRDIHLLSSKTKGMIVRSKVVQDVETECALMAEFENDERFLVYPQERILNTTGYEDDLDTILEILQKRRYRVNRSAVKDLNLLLPGR